MVREFFYYNGEEANAPEGWGDFELGMRFDNDSVQANIDTLEVTLTGKANRIVRDWRAFAGAYEGCPFRWSTVDPAATNLPLSLEAYLDMNEGFEIISPVKCKCFIRTVNSLNDLQNKLDGMSFGLLMAKNKIALSDQIQVMVCVKKEFVGAELGLLLVTAVLMTRELKVYIKTIVYQAKQAVVIATGGLPVIAAIIAFGALAIQIVIEGAYMSFVVGEYLRVVKSLFAYLYPPARKQLCLTEKRALEIIFEEAGYEFKTSLPLERIPFIPSKPQHSDTLGFTPEGIPNQTDYGYRCIQILELAKNMFEAKLRVTEQSSGNPLAELISLNDPGWTRHAAYDGKDVLNEGIRDNSTELTATTLISYAQDPTNFHNTDQWQGSTYEVTVEPITIVNPKHKTIKGYKHVNFPVALAARKGPHSDLEKAIIATAKVYDTIAGLFGPKYGLEQKIKDREGYVVVSNNYWSVPQVCIWDGSGPTGGIPANYKDIISARALYENYISYRSHVSNSFGGQRRIVTGEKIPFTMADWLAVADNKWFKTFDGVDAEFTSIKWKPGRDYAIADYRRMQTDPNTNLKERKIEQV